MLKLFCSFVGTSLQNCRTIAIFFVILLVIEIGLTSGYLVVHWTERRRTYISWSLKSSFICFLIRYTQNLKRRLASNSIMPWTYKSSLQKRSLEYGNLTSLLTLPSHFSLLSILKVTVIELLQSLGLHCFASLPKLLVCYATISVYMSSSPLLMPEVLCV